MEATQTVTADTDKLKNHDCVRESAIEIFTKTCGIKLEEINGDGAGAADEMILAVISLVGDVEWSVFMGLPQTTATAVVAKFAGFQVPFESSDMGDAVGELTNILAGEVKARLDRRGIKADISLPSVVRGSNLRVLVSRDTPASRNCFQSECGKLWTGVVAGKNL